MSEQTFVDRTGLPVMPGDVIKVWHFVARRRKTIWMYKKVFRVDGDNHLASDGAFWSAVALSDLGEKPFEKCHRCLLQHCGEFEVIDGPSVIHADRSMTCWWERPRQSKTSERGQRDRMATTC